MYTLASIGTPLLIACRSLLAVGHELGERVGPLFDAVFVLQKGELAQRLLVDEHAVAVHLTDPEAARQTVGPELFPSRPGQRRIRPTGEVVLSGFAHVVGIRDAPLAAPPMDVRLQPLDGL